MHHHKADDRADLFPSKSSLSHLILPPASDPSLCFPAKIDPTFSARTVSGPSSSPRQPPPPPPHHSDVVGGRSGGLLHLPPKRHPLLSDTVADVVLLIASAAGSSCTAISHSADALQQACACTCSRTPSKHSYVNIHFPPTVTLRTVFLFCYFFSSGLIQEWSKSICLTFVHNIWPVVYSTQQLITNATSAHVFPFTTRSEGTHHPACYYPAPSTTMSPFSVGSTRGKNGLLSMNTMRCGQTRSIVEERGGGVGLSKSGLHHPRPPTQLNKPHECGDTAHQSCRGYTRSV